MEAAPPTDESINKMMDVMQVERMLSQMAVQMDSGMRAGIEQGFRQSLQGKEPTSAQTAKVEEIKAKMNGMIKEEVSFAKTRDIYLQVYRETFTQEEVNGMIAFYGSPAGKAMVEKLPVAMQKGGGLMQQRLAPTMQKMQGMLEETLREPAKAK